VLSNNALNVALTNVDPTNVALSNAVLSNNALSNVALSNNALSNVVLSNNALTNAVLSNVALSNVALSNNVLSNNALSNVALSNAPLGDAANGGDPDALSTIEVGSAEIANNDFKSTDLAASQFNFKETTFTIRNRGNTDTTVSFKLLLRDADCSTLPCTPPKDPATGKPLYKLQLIVRKVALVPVPIPPTGPATGDGRRDLRIGFAQTNTEVSNITDLLLIDPSGSSLGRFNPIDPTAAMLSLGAGEFAYATIRAIGVKPGFDPPDPAELLQWGVKTVAANATTANGPLLISNFALSGFEASPPAQVSGVLATLGGKPTITGNAVCTRADGSLILNLPRSPLASDGVDGNYYIDTSLQWLYGPKTAGAWGTGVSLIHPADAKHATPYATDPCPPAPIALGPFTSVTATDGFVSSTAPLTFQPKYWGDFFTLTSVADAGSPPQTDRQLVKVHVDPRKPLPTYASSNTDPKFPLCALASGFLTAQTYNNKSIGISLAGCVDSDSVTGAGVKQPIMLTAGGGACHILDNDHLLIDNATVGTGYTCDVTVHQDGNEIFDQVTQTKSIVINKADSIITFGVAPSNVTYGNNPVTVTATTLSSTAPASAAAVTFVPRDPTVCSVVSTTNTALGAWSASIAINSGVNCVIDAIQTELASSNYNSTATVSPQSFLIAKADQQVSIGTPPAGLRFGDLPFGVAATLATINVPPHIPPIAANSNEPITFAVVPATSTVCSVGASASNAVTVTILSKGTCTIQASVPGDLTKYNAATASVDIVIAAAQMTVNATVSPASIIYGDDVPPGAVAITTGSTVGILPVTAPCNTTPFTTTQAGVPTAPANVGSYSITATITSTVNVNCDVTLANATFSVTQAPTQFTVQTLPFTSLGGSTAFTGKVNRIGKPTVFPSGSASIIVQKGTNPPAATLNAATAGVDGAFSVTDGPPPTIPSDSYAVTYSFPATTNFQAPPAAMATLRVEGVSSAGAMTTARTHHATVLLTDGRVLATGGDDGTGTPTNTAEIYCPDSYVVPVSPPALPLAQLCPGGLGGFGAMDMNQPRTRHTATVHPATGKVIVVGGVVGASNLDEVWDPVAQTWANVTISSARFNHTATLVAGGKIFIAGGNDSAGNTLSTTVIYDPATGSSVAGPVLNAPRERHTATLLQNGTVLIAGGRKKVPPPPAPFTVWDSAEIYDPAGNTITTLAATAMSDMRFSQSDVLLNDGRALIAGGSADVNGATSVGSADSFTGTTFSPLPPAPSGALIQVRREFTMTKLTDAWVIAIGGFDSLGNPLGSAEMFEPLTVLGGQDKFMPGITFVNARAGHTATRLSDGRVLVLGGTGSGGAAIKSAEFYNGP
jgi:hypothetical protein